MGDGVCEVAYAGTAQDITVLKYKETFDEWPTMDYLHIIGVAFHPESSRVMIKYEHTYDDRFVVERWEGCEFVEASDWWEE